MKRIALIPIFLITYLIFGAICIIGQKTTRKNLKPSFETVKRSKSNIQIDTIATAADSSAIVFSGYEKTLTSTKESFFVTNHTDSCITDLNIEITYLDMKNRPLDTRQVNLATDILPGQTRRFDIGAWDRQKVFYYYLSPTPRASHATPYKVNIRLITALRKH